MPIEYEFETVDCPLRVYASKREYTDEEGWGLEVIIQPESGIEQFNEHIVKYVSDGVAGHLEEAITFEDDTSPIVRKNLEPPQVEIYITVRDGAYTVVDIGQEIARGIQRAEQAVTESSYVDSGDFNMGAASVLYNDD